MGNTKNKGEWSELFVLVELLSSGKLYAADEFLQRMNGVYFPVLKVIKNLGDLNEVDYVIRETETDVYLAGKKVTTLTKDYLDQSKTLLLQGIQNGKGAFEIASATELLKELQIGEFKARSTCKADITVKIHDIHTGYESVCGFSIKSEFGGSPTLLNASGATNFVYEIMGISDLDMNRINSISTRTKIIDRIEEITKLGDIRFVSAQNACFSSNLMLIDSFMEEIVGLMVLDFYKNKVIDCRSLIANIESINPLGYPREGFYKYKFKKFLCSVALGLMPGSMWNGLDEANGGYIISKKSGEVLAYHLYNRAAFESYLLNNTKLEKPSSTKFDYAQIYKDNGKYYINLSLQIRFI